MTTVARSWFDLALPAFALEAGGRVGAPLARVWVEGPTGSFTVPEASLVSSAEMERVSGGGYVRRSGSAALELHRGLPGGFRLTRGDVPVVVVIHALTGDMRAGGDGGWWTPLIGPGCALDTSRSVVLCVNNLGSCYGSSGPADGGFPGREDAEPSWSGGTGPGSFDLIAAAAEGVVLPATVTTWDQAGFVVACLDALEVGRVHGVTGGSVGGMTALCLGMLAPERIGHLVPVAATVAADAWIQGWNHTARMLVLGDASSGEAEGGRGLELARQVAHMSYRAPAGLGERQGRRQPGGERWSPSRPYAVQTYLEYQGRKLRQRFHAGAYLTQLDAMDHHDLLRCPSWLEGDSGGWALSRLTMPVSAIGIDSDMLYPAVEMERLADRVSAEGGSARYVEIASLHGHDGFLIEWDQMEQALRRALGAP